MKVLVLTVAVLVALVGLVAAAPHNREEDRGVFDYDYKDLWKHTAMEEDMFDKEGVAVDRMIGKKADKPARKEHHHHHHSHHHHKEHLKTNRVRNFFDDFRL